MIDPAYLEKLGVFFDERTQTYMRHRLRTTNVEYDPDDPSAVQKGLVVGYDEELIPFPVVLAPSLDAASVEEARSKAVARSADFYHPTLGWLRWGKKREQEHPENLGSGAVQYERRHVTVKPSTTRKKEV